MRYCPHCGDPVENDWSYCQSCGTELAQYRREQPATRSSPERPQNTGTSRRNIVAGTGVLVLIGGVGGAAWWTWNLLNDDPADVAAEFMEALANGNFADANELLHSKATIDGAGTATDLISAVMGVDAIFEVADVSVVDTETVRETDNQAVVRTTLNIDVGLDETQGDVLVELRDDDGDWGVWNIRG